MRIKTTTPASAHLRLLLLLSNRLSNSLMDIWTDIRLDSYICMCGYLTTKQHTNNYNAHTSIFALFIHSKSVYFRSCLSSNVYLSIAMVLDVSCMAICLSPIHLNSTRFNEPFFLCRQHFFIPFSSSLFHTDWSVCCCLFVFVNLFIGRQ